eukprot:1189825-Prorocentrum_minimum.AAC.5
MPTDCHMAGRQSTPGLGSDAIIQGVGTMCENHFRSGSTLKAIPCELSRTIPPPPLLRSAYAYHRARHRHCRTDR